MMHLMAMIINEDDHYDEVDDDDILD